MRHIVTTFVALSLAWSSAAFAEGKAAPAGGNQMMGAETGNIWISPVGMAFGAINATAEFKLGDSFSIGPSVAYSSYSSGSNEATSFGFGASATFYLGHNAFTDGWFLSPFFQYASASNDFDQTATGIVGGADVGYGWFWESGFNLMLGFGVQQIALELSDLGLADVGGTLPSLRMSLGFAF